MVVIMIVIMIVMVTIMVVSAVVMAIMVVSAVGMATTVRSCESLRRRNSASVPTRPARFVFRSRLIRRRRLTISGVPTGEAQKAILSWSGGVEK